MVIPMIIAVWLTAVYIGLVDSISDLIEPSSSNKAMEHLLK